MNIKITADSTCDLTRPLVEKYGITITPLTVYCGYESFHDGIDITPDALYDKIAASGQPASTAAVNIQEYIKLRGDTRRILVSPQTFLIGTN